MLWKSEPPRILVGLGNPGKEYARTRHNLGATAVRDYAERAGLVFKTDRTFGVAVAKGKCAGGKLAHLVLPTGYMNESGRPIAAYLNYYEWGPEQLLIAVDDVAIPFTELRLRVSGSAGGHNGLKSIQECLGTEQYARLRMGVGDREHGTLSDHVLGVFSAEEMQELPALLERSKQIIDCWLDQGLPAAMRISGKKPQQSTQEEKDDAR